VEQQLSRSLSRLETQDIKTQPQFNHYLKANTPPSLKEFHTVVRHLVIIRWFQRLIPVKGASQRTTQETTDPRDGWIPAACPILSALSWPTSGSLDFHGFCTLFNPFIFLNKLVLFFPCLSHLLSRQHFFGISYLFSHVSLLYWKELIC